jgi:tRNA pseudouridine55 synthase
MEGFLLIDKPAGMTSHDVVDRVRRVTGIKRVGHAGTLDPFATGLLIVGVGRSATRHMQEIVGLPKEYDAVFFLGATTETDDIEGELQVNEQAKDPGKETIQEHILPFLGDIKQVPPTYSAVKIKGKKMYEAARENKPLTAPARKVHIDAFDVTDYTWPELTVHITCGSGTYIRALARDLGSSLTTGAYVKELRRTSIGPFQIEESVHLNTLEHEDWSTFLIPSERLLHRIPTPSPESPQGE